jgi:hypothetical protein
VRKAIFILFMLAIAGLGGYVAHGPVPFSAQPLLKWLKQSDSGFETVTASNFGNEPASDSATNGNIPAAPLPPLAVGPVPEETSPAANSPTPSLAAKNLEQHPAEDALVPERQESRTAGRSAPSRGVPTATESTKATGAVERNTLSRLDREISRSGVKDGQAKFSRPDGKPDQGNGFAAVSGWGNIVGSAPASAMPSRLEREVIVPSKTDDVVIPASGISAQGVSSQQKLKSSGEEWKDLSHRLKAAGVTRFWVEGIPGGNVLFRCVVPVVGRQAIGQLFEAQGPDIVYAAENTLRRITLWRATEGP